VRGLAIHVAKTVGINITYYILQVDTWSTQMVTSDTTPHVYGRVLLMVTFSSSKQITMIPQTGVSGIVDSTTSTAQQGDDPC